jgi:hypothetical protein
MRKAHSVIAEYDRIYYYSRTIAPLADDYQPYNEPPFDGEEIDPPHDAYVFWRWTLFATFLFWNVVLWAAS